MVRRAPSRSRFEYCSGSHPLWLEELESRLPPGDMIGLSGAALWGLSAGVAPQDLHMAPPVITKAPRAWDVVETAGLLPAPVSFRTFVFQAGGGQQAQREPERIAAFETSNRDLFDPGLIIDLSVLPSNPSKGQARPAGTWDNSKERSLPPTPAGGESSGGAGAPRREATPPGDPAPLAPPGSTGSLGGGSSSTGGGAANKQLNAGPVIVPPSIPPATPLGFVSQDPIDEDPLPLSPGDYFASNSPDDFSAPSGDEFSGGGPEGASFPSGDIFSGNGSGGSSPPSGTSGTGDYFPTNPVSSPPSAPPANTFCTTSSCNPCSSTTYSPIVQPDLNNGQGGAVFTQNPVREFDGMPLIASSDLSSGAFGFAWGQTRSWTGLNNSSLNGNGWAVDELPYLTVGGGTNGAPGHTDLWPGTTQDDRITLIEGGANTFTFTVPSSAPYTSYAPWGAQNIRLDWVSGSPSVLRLTDSQGNQGQRA